MNVTFQRIQIDECIAAVVDFPFYQCKKEQKPKKERKLSEFIIKLKYRDFPRNAMTFFSAI